MEITSEKLYSLIEKKMTKNKKKNEQNNNKTLIT